MSIFGAECREYDEHLKMHLEDSARKYPRYELPLQFRRPLASIAPIPTPPYKAAVAAKPAQHPRHQYPQPQRNK